MNPRRTRLPFPEVEHRIRYEKLVVITRKTRLELLVERFGTVGQAKFYIEHSGADFSAYQEEHDNYCRALDLVKHQIEGMAKLHVVERSFVPNFLFTPRDVVIAVGQDGLVVNVAKYLTGQPVVGINPDPARFDGVLVPFLPQHTRNVMLRILGGRFDSRHITMAEGNFSDGQKALAFNDFFIGARSHVSARYAIRFGSESEEHSSSGIIVSTGAGSTGWLSSTYNMAAGMGPLVYGDTVQKKSAPSTFAWEERRLRFVVREPFRSRSSQANIVTGDVTPEKILRIESHIPEGGVVFSDGVEADFVPFNSGTSVEVRVSERTTNLVLPTERGNPRRINRPPTRA